MSKECYTPKEIGSSVTVDIDVTKIVKYACITGVFIVGIIFGTRCYYKLLEKNSSET